MITNILSVRFLPFCLTLAFLAGTALVTLPRVRAEEQAGSNLESLQAERQTITVIGMVKVNGKPAATGDTISSGATVETAAKSSAVVSLGKLGRVEALPETQMNLSFDDRSISILLDTGSVRVSTGPGVSATITTKDD